MTTTPHTHGTDTDAWGPFEDYGPGAQCAHLAGEHGVLPGMISPSYAGREGLHSVLHTPAAAAADVRPLNAARVARLRQIGPVLFAERPRVDPDLTSTLLALCDSWNDWASAQLSELMVLLGPLREALGHRTTSVPADLDSLRALWDQSLDEVRTAVGDAALAETAYSAREQIEQLAGFIVANVPDEPSRSEGAVECAIRLLGDLVHLREAVTELAPAPPAPPARYEGRSAESWAQEAKNRARKTQRMGAELSKVKSNLEAARAREARYGACVQGVRAAVKEGRSLDRVAEALVAFDLAAAEAGDAGPIGQRLARALRQAQEKAARPRVSISDIRGIAPDRTAAEAARKAEAEKVMWDVSLVEGGPWDNEHRFSLGDRTIANGLPPSRAEQLRSFLREVAPDRERRGDGGAS